MGRIAAIDFGMKRIGIALSDERKKIAFPLSIVAGGKKQIFNIKEALGEKLKEVELILVGLPLLMSGQEGDMALAVKKFAGELEEGLKVPVQLVDERLSSKMADRSLREIHHLNRKERTEKIDSAAAAMLLQDFLDRMT